MSAMWSLIAKFIETIAGFGAGAASSGYGYEPELPEDLRK